MTGDNFIKMLDLGRIGWEGRVKIQSFGIMFEMLSSPPKGEIMKLNGMCSIVYQTLIIPVHF